MVIRYQIRRLALYIPDENPKYLILKMLIFWRRVAAINKASLHTPSLCTKYILSSEFRLMLTVISLKPHHTEAKEKLNYGQIREYK